MELITFTFAAGETKRFERAGRYIEVIDALAPVSLFLSDRSGARVGYAVDALSGMYLGGAFAALDIYSATAQTVELLITDGDGGSRRQPGNVAIIDSVPAAVQTMTQAMGVAIGFNAVELLAPAANVGGFIIRSLSGYVQSGVGGLCNARLVCSPAAPTDTAAGANRLWMADVISVDGSLERFQFPDLARRIPAGWGIWSVSAALTVGIQQGQHFVSGELL